MSDERLSLRQVIRAFVPFLRSSAGLLALCVISLLLATAMEVALPYLVGRATDAVALHQALSELARFCAFFLAAALARWGLEAAHSWGLQRAGQRFTAELREAVYDRALRQPVRYHDENASGKIATRVLYDVRALGEVFSAAVSVLALDVFVIVASVGAMLAYNWRLALGCLVPFPLLVFSLRYFGPRLGAAYRDARTRLSNLNGFLGEHLGALPTIQQLAAEENRDRRLAQYADDYEKAQRSAVHLFSLVQPCTNVVNGISTAAVLCIGGYEVLRGRATPGVVIAFLAYQKNLFQPIRDLVEKYNVFLAARVAAERVIGLLHAAEEGTSGKSSSILLAEESAPKFAAAPEVVFEGVSFGYGEHANVLHGVTFRVQPGNAVAVVGPTGSGKSSLLRLLLRFYEPRAGRILLNGHDVARLRLEQLRTTCAYVSQEIYLFRGTLRENLKLVAPEKADAVLREVCERVRLWPLLQGRGGLDFSIAEGGANLSAGERQLVAFARVLLRDAPLLLFDEATANLDGALERTVSEVAWELFRDRTAVVIAHRLETVLRCPQLVFFEAGRVADAGVPDELLAGNGPFAQWLATRERATTSARA